MRRKIILTLASEGRDVLSKDIDDETLKKAVAESRWRLGEGFINGVWRPVERKEHLDEYSYRMGEHILSPSSVEMWRETEYMEWRDK